jgi:hypothetical protein
MPLNKSVLTRLALIVGAVVAVAYLVHFPSMRNFVDLSVGIAWPAAAVIVVFLFREQLINLAGRIKRIGKDGAEFEQPQRPLIDDQPLANPGAARLPVGTSPGGPASGGSLDDMVAPVFRPLFRQRAEQARDRLPAAKAMFPSESETNILLAWCGELNAALHLDRASRFIFQSQIEALEALKWRTSVKAEFRPYYDRAAQVAPATYAEYSFDQWYNFLIVMELIAGRDDAVTVTHVGEAIAMYMGQQHYRAFAA